MDKVQHFELPADNMDRAGKFYQEVFGWKIKDAGVEGMNYHMAYTTEVDEKYMPKEFGVINGAIFERKNSETPMIVITVQNIRNSIRKVNEKGGALLGEPREIPGMGIYAVVKDTEGNAVGLWESLKKEDK